MTTTEFSNEFDITYNSIATNSAPSIDLYEKSVYLTRAQLEIVNNYFNPKGNKYNKGFEQSTKRRVDLKELIRPFISSTESTNLSGAEISDDSQFFKIPDDVFLIIQEKVRVTSTDDCIDGQYIKVVPKTHDEFNIQENNPFKKPDEKEAWRLDIYTKSGDSFPGENVELLSAYTIDRYKFRYVKFPSPIILVNLLTEFPSDNLSIDGITAEQTCALGQHIHREIVNRAAELATADYKKDNLTAKVEINKRNE